MSKEKIIGFIGSQQVLQEEKNGNVYRVTLEARQEAVLGGGGKRSTAKGLGETEVLEFPEQIYNDIKTQEAIDDSTLREKWCSRPIAELILTLINNAVPVANFEYLFQNAINNIKIAETTKDRKDSGIHELNRNVYQLKNEILEE